MGSSSSSLKPAKYGSPGDLGALRGVVYSAARTAAAPCSLMVAVGSLFVDQYNYETADRRLRVRRANENLITSFAVCPNSPFGCVMLAGTQHGAVALYALDTLK